MDKEVLRDIWHGQLPLCFKLHPDDVSGMHRPEPYYMMVPRVTYFPIVLDRVVKYFNRFMDQSKNSTDEMWLDFDGQHIKAHHPIGLSWDLFGTSYELPWRLILHFSDFPSKDLVKCNSKASIKSIFMSSIKEADALKHKGSVTKNMLEKDQNLLWSSLVNDKFDQFWSINKRLMDRIDNELFRCIPFRLYFPDYTYIQKIIKPCTIEKQLFFNPNLLNHNQQLQQQDHDGGLQIPPIYAKDTVINNKAHKCSHSASDIEEARLDSRAHRYSTMLDLIQCSFSKRLDDLLVDNFNKPQQTDELIDVKFFRYRFLSHGIEIPFDTPLQWLSEHLSYPDNFLHICAVKKEDKIGTFTY
uniref:Autophagy protein 5 n=1 Tax=Aceria tosichella TaxID=561515 RepID=A0A6G1SK62_9ACAR